MKKIFFISLMLFLQSCIKTVEVEMPKDEPRQVLNCLFTPGKTFKVNLTKSIDITNNDSNTIDNATVVIYEDGVEMETLVYDGYNYNSELLAQSNKTYKITASADGLEEVTASNIIPAQPLVVVDDFISQAYYNTNYGGYYGQVTMTINDDEMTTNFYEAVVVRHFVRENEDDDEDDETIVAPTGIELCSDPLLSNEISDQKYPTHLVFTDKSFNGEMRTMSFDFINHFDDTYTPVSYKIILRSITEDYYKYKKRLNKHTDFRLGEVYDILIEPIQMYSNIENGFGIFAGYNEYSEEF